MSSLWSTTRKGISNQGVESDSDAEPDIILGQVSPYELFADQLINQVSKIETLSDENEIERLKNENKKLQQDNIKLNSVIKHFIKKEEND
ncbi:hypothetical protein M0813_29226 [Anaeramoeba flamelloides]|uniref:Uncharacterized protein n=1 Tax=Anaeramoeba flamelloides TaxID=1746091 RepID=A0AAV7Y136_9EUKA|nr:hypothetical protein M0812_30104 [Anaeramoeba flamelloides]KAJ6234633.1 hypothetical protein M0813_29226 [Anaeramoeba flamelloides]